MKRRHFLQTTAAATVLPTLLGGLPIGAYGFSPELFEITGGATQTDRVVLQPVASSTAAPSRGPVYAQELPGWARWVGSRGKGHYKKRKGKKHDD